MGPNLQPSLKHAVNSHNCHNNTLTACVDFTHGPRCGRDRSAVVDRPQRSRCAAADSLSFDTVTLVPRRSPTQTLLMALLLQAFSQKFAFLWAKLAGIAGHAVVALLALCPPQARCRAHIFTDKSWTDNIRNEIALHPLCKNCLASRSATAILP